MGLSNLQTKIISGAFDLKNATIDLLTTPMERVFSLSFETVIDAKAIELLKLKGYSRVPVYYGDNKTFILGVLIVKSLVGVDVAHPKTLRELSKKGECMIRTPVYASPQATVGNMLNIFKEGTAHLAIVVLNPKQIVDETNLVLEAIKLDNDMQLSTSTQHQIIGITTLEKIIEQILRTHIFDEKDMDKRMRNDNQFSITLQEESNINL